MLMTRFAKNVIWLLDNKTIQRDSSLNDPDLGVYESFQHLLFLFSN